MSKSKNSLADLFNLQSRFLRSVHLERDYNSPDTCSGYVLTDFTKACIERLVEGLVPGSGSRAWRLTGDYGSGKSSFALMLAHLLSDRRTLLPPSLRNAVDLNQFGMGDRNLIPVLVTGTRKPLGLAVLTSLYKTIRQVYTNGSHEKITRRLFEITEGRRQTSEDEIIDIIVQFNSIISSESKGNGLLFILDELGKFLEYSAMYPGNQDIYILQRLAETASRSGVTPLFILGLLHQGFSAYADHLDQTSQKEWEKIAGRFDEILFHQPIEQLIILISSALGIDAKRLSNRQRSEAIYAMQSAIKWGWYGPVPVRDPLLEIAPNLFPIDPIAIPVITRTMHRFGQNERSLFSFIQSSEPFGLNAFSMRPLSNARPYRLNDFYDYIRTNLGHRLSLQSAQTHWNVIDSIIQGYSYQDTLEVDVLKAVGALNLLNNNDLLPTEEIIICSLAGRNREEKKHVKDIIQRLKKEKHILYDRGISGGLCLWPHTSVDLDKAYNKASRAVGPIQRASETINDFLGHSPIVARRHYIQTGNLRYFNIRYSSVSQLEQTISDPIEDADGVIIVVLCDTEKDRQNALQAAQDKKLHDRPELIIAISNPLNNIIGYIKEANVWDRVSTNTLELNSDPYAREEVSRKNTAARSRLEKRIQDLVDLKRYSGQMDIEWFSCEKPMSISSGKELLTHLSTVCDDVFNKAPIIHNELINRQNLSSAAAAARMRLIERMLEKENQENLGMPTQKRPPEMSIYLSILKAGGLHVKSENSWKISLPLKSKDICNLLPSLQRILAILKEKPDSKVSVADLFAELRRPPYGIRDGIRPILLTIFAKAYNHEIAFYEDGTFLSSLSSENLLRLTKAPDTFEIQLCSIKGVREDLINQFAKVLNLNLNDKRDSYLLEVVKPLCVFVAELPEYVHNTKKLTKKTLNVRDAILDAIDPARLIFQELPTACGHEPFNGSDSFSKRNKTKAAACAQDLSEALNELRMAYPKLKERLFKEIKTAFDLSKKASKHVRHHVAERVEGILVGIIEPRLKAFALRLYDANLPESEWIESVGSYLTAKPPLRWDDTHKDLFSRRLFELTGQLKRVESAVFGKRGDSNKRIGIRLAITLSDGYEKQEVVYVDPDENERLQQLQEEVKNILTKEGRLGLAAISRAVWSVINDED